MCPGETSPRGAGRQGIGPTSGNLSFVENSQFAPFSFVLNQDYRIHLFVCFLSCEAAVRDKIQVTEQIVEAETQRLGHAIWNHDLPPHPEWP